MLNTIVTNKSEKTMKILVTPMGASKGLLYSAIALSLPDIAIVLTSNQFKDKVQEATEKANRSDYENIHTIIINDAFVGFNETDRIVSEIMGYVKNSDDININLTGGTTAMQWMMQAVYEKCSSNGIKVKRVAFVDRRPAVEQQSNPYVLGEMVDIEKIIQK